MFALMILSDTTANMYYIYLFYSLHESDNHIGRAISEPYSKYVKFCNGYSYSTSDGYNHSNMTATVYVYFNRQVLKLIYIISFITYLISIFL